MPQLIVYWIIQTIAILISAYLLPGVHVQSFMTAFIVAVVLGIINAFVKPVLLFFTFPITLATLGLFVLVLNAFLIILTSKIVPGFSVDTFWWAILFSIVLSIVSSVLERVSK